MAANFRNGNLFCDACGTEYKLEMPCPIETMTKTIKVFEGVHKNCKKTWEEPKADMKQTIEQRAMWWIEGGGETGLSSKTMWNCFMGQKKSKLIIHGTRTIFQGVINYWKLFQNGKKGFQN